MEVHPKEKEQPRDSGGPHAGAACPPTLEVTHAPRATHPAAGPVSLAFPREYRLRRRCVRGRTARRHRQNRGDRPYRGWDTGGSGSGIFLTRLSSSWRPVL